MKSMTGYALTEKHFENAAVSLELKSYNARYLDVAINLPFWLSGLEPFFKNLICKNVNRGKVEIYLRVKNSSLEVEVTPNTEIALAYVKAAKKIAQAAGLSEDLDLGKLISQEGVLSIEKNIDLNAWQNMLQPVFDETISKFNQTRITEGKALKKDILFNLEKINSSVNLIKTQAPKMEELFYKNIKEKANELLGSQVDENRIMQELALMMIKYTINEEIVRLEAHCKTLQKELALNEPIGKKLDFICQEINREINTIGSKNQMVEMTNSIITVKDALENIREQSRNVE